MKVAHLSQCHFSDNGQHNFLPFGGVGVLFMLVQPRFKGGSRFSSGVFTTGGQIVTCTVSATNKSLGKFADIMKTNNYYNVKN